VTTRFGDERLTLDVVNKDMERTKEPAFTRISAACMFLIMFVNNVSLPWYGDSWSGCKYGWHTGGAGKGLPTAAGQPGCDPETLGGGIPRWFVGCLVTYVITIALDLVAWQYEPQDEAEAYAPWCGKLTGMNGDDDGGEYAAGPGGSSAKVVKEDYVEGELEAGGYKDKDGSRTMKS
jgi:hypothetical protein